MNLSTQRHYLLCLAVGVLYFLVAKFSLNLAFANTSVSPIWPPAGIALAAMFLIGYRVIPFIALAAFAANLANLYANHLPINASSITVCATIGLGNTFAAVVGTQLMQRSNGSADLLQRFQTVFRFVLVVLIAGLASAVPGTLSLIWGGVVPAVAWQAVLITWWVGDACGMLVMTPLILCGWLAWRDQKPELNLAVNGLFVLVLAGVLGLIFARPFAESNPILLVLLLPLIAIAAWQDGGRGVTRCVFISVIAAIIATLQGRGPFADADLNSALIALDSFIAVWCVSGLALAADLRERRQLQPDRKAARSVLIPWLILLLGISLTTLAWHQAQIIRRDLNQKQFNVLSRDIAERIFDRLKVYEHILQGTRGLFAIKPDLSRAEWQEYVENLFIKERLPGVQAIGYAAYIHAEQKTEFERQQRAVWPSFTVRPAGEREIYAPVVFIEPADWRNQRAIGLDLYFESVRQVGVKMARDTGLTTITGKLKLAQETAVKPQNGFILMIPIYQHGAPIETVAQRRVALRGLAASPFRMDDFMLAVLGRDMSGVALQIYDGSSMQVDAQMYSNGVGVENGSIARQELQIVLPNHHWTLRVAASKGFVAQVSLQNERLILMGGLVISLLLFGLVRSLMLTNLKAIRLSKTMAASLKTAEAKFSSLVDTSYEAIIIANQAGRIVSFNPGAEMVFGYMAADVVGQELAILIPERFQSAHWAGLTQRVKTGDMSNLARQVELSALHQQGHEFPISLSLSGWESDNVIYFGAIVLDLTLRKQTEAALAGALKAAESASLAKSAFLANMSHEIRTPLNAILGFSSLLQDTELSRQQQEFIAAIQAGGDALLAQINDLLDFSKIEAGKLDIEHIDFDVRRTLEDSLDLVSAKAFEKELDLACIFDPMIPLRLCGDPSRIRQIMLNLLNNAIKFTAQGEVVARVRAIAENETQYRLFVEVTDSGVGIPPEVQAKLFQPFIQADSSTTREFGGTGLGLSICKRLAEAMGGEISVHSEGGKGATFRFNLLLGKTEIDESMPRLPVSLQGKKALVVDHFAANRELLSLQLHSMGMQVSTAASAEAAMQQLQQEHDFAVAILDEIALGQAIHAQADSAQLSLVLVTAFGQQGQAALAHEVGFSAFLTLPLHTSQLHQCLIEALSLQSRPIAERPLVTLHHIAEQQIKTYVLLAEDNPVNQKIAVLMLEKLGCRVDVAENGYAAVVAVAQNQYDLVFMDCQMPEMDGFVATTTIRAMTNEKSKTPIVALTANAFNEDIQRCQAAGMDDFLSKPVKIENLKKVIEQWMGRQS